MFQKGEAMHVLHLKDHFARIGARAKLSPRTAFPGCSDPWPILVTIGLDDRGEFFDIQLDPARDVVLDVSETRPHAAALLLGAIAPDGSIAQRVLCGVERGRLIVQMVPDDVKATSVLGVRRALRADAVEFVRTLHANDGVDGTINPSIIHSTGRTGDIARRV